MCFHWQEDWILSDNPLLRFPFQLYSLSDSSSMKIALIYFFIHVKYYFISLKPYKLTIYFAVIMILL